MDPVLAGAQQVCQAVATVNPFFIGRNGTIEAEVLYFWMTKRRDGASYPPRALHYLQNNAGVFPYTEESVDAWCEAYTKALAYLTGGAAGWYAPMIKQEAAVLDAYTPQTAFRVPLRSLEPYYVGAGNRWTEHLRGRNVCVVSSFADTIKNQIGKPIWRGAQVGLLPETIQWSFVRTGYAPSVGRGSAEWPEGCATWQEAVEYVVREVEATGAEVALIGCGGLGMVIAGRLRQKGISSIVLGGAIQVLFGIKGRRWANHSVISGLWNDAWVSPAADEIPGGAASVEGGCYW